MPQQPLWWLKSVDQQGPGIWLLSGCCFHGRLCSATTRFISHQQPFSASSLHGLVRVHIYIWAKRYLPKQARIIQTLLQSVWASLVAQLVKNLSAMQKTPVQFLKNLQEACCSQIKCVFTLLTEKRGLFCVILIKIQFSKCVSSLPLYLLF